MTWQQVVLLAAIHISGERMKVLIKKSIASLLTTIVLMGAFLVNQDNASKVNADVGQIPLDIPTLEEVNAQAYCVFDKTAGEVILSKNPDQTIYPASMTKIMTALLGLDYLSTDAYLTVSQESIDATTLDSTLMGLSVGESVKVSELLYGMMLPSGNDAANVVAEGVVEALINQYPSTSDEVGPDGVNASYLETALGMSSQEILETSELAAFAKLMTLRATNIGCTGSNFVNANGLHDDMHYTTASDLTLIMSKAIENPDFCTIISSPTHIFAGTNIHTEDGWSIVRNTNNLLNDPWLAATTHEGEETHLAALIGGKTGTTSVAGTGMTLYTVNENGHELLISVCGIPYEESGWQTRYVASVTAYGNLQCWQNDPQSVIPGTTGDYRRFNSTLEEQPQYDPLIIPGQNTDMSGYPYSDVATTEPTISDEANPEESNPSSTGQVGKDEDEDKEDEDEKDKEQLAIVIFAKENTVFFVALSVLALLIVLCLTMVIIRVINIQKRKRRKPKMRPKRSAGDYIR